VFIVSICICTTFWQAAFGVINDEDDGGDRKSSWNWCGCCMGYNCRPTCMLMADCSLQGKSARRAGTTRQRACVWATEMHAIWPLPVPPTIRLSPIALGRSAHLAPEGATSIVIGPSRRLPGSTHAWCKVKWSIHSRCRCLLKMVELLWKKGLPYCFNILLTHIGVMQAWRVTYI